MARKWLGLVDKFILFPLALRKLAPHYDLIHICDHTNAPYVLALGGSRVSLTCHDLIPIKVLTGEVEGQSLPLTGRLLQQLVRFALKRIKHVVHVSEATRADFHRLIGQPAGSEAVIANPVIGFGTMGKDRAAHVLNQAGLPTDRAFLFHIGSNLWYKNRSGVVRLFGLLRRNHEWAAAVPDALMICAGPPLPETVIAEAQDWRENLVMINEPSPELIEALYMRAKALLFPSLDEGFGWPIVEAQACGCPVITSDREPMRSVAGPASLLIDPTQSEKAAQTIAARWSWLMAQSDAARTHARLFSEDAIARQYSDYVAGLGATPAEDRAA